MGMAITSLQLKILRDGETALLQAFPWPKYTDAGAKCQGC